MLKLKFTDPQMPTVELNTTRLAIGRDKSNDLVLADTDISAFHAEIQTEETRSYLVDLGSANGSFVGGKKIVGRQEIRAWDTIRFGSVDAEVVDPGQRHPTTVMAVIGDADLKRGLQATTVRPVIGDWSLLGANDPVRGKVFPLVGKMVMGRGPGCDIVIDSSCISGKHAELEEKAGCLQIRDLSSTNGTFVAGKKITFAELRSGDEFRIDEVVFKVQGPVADISRTMVRSAVGLGKKQVNKAVAGTQLGANAAGNRLVGRGVFSGQIFNLKGAVLTVGRTEENDIVLNEATVSSRHARLLVVGGGWKVEDSGSQNGTIINGKPVESQELKDGDLISFGKAECCYQNSAEQVSKTSTKIMGAVEAETVTSVRAVAKKSLLAWTWGAGGFAVVALCFGAFLLANNFR
ncbi:FHA domain-containing protein [Desulfotalea psychrophila]|uniref:FHA domain-containing protein n=1 Tax=Desulfotalea psychrophila (strain LSv54 / DSM 12343) TaxID=177439 RepID=Q6AK27_DESPS|nr:FHA domain-containing protein [Desulfotalea psychrophila]CAG37299.1 hypothetical protein DP2570 [Desulfotalea psychrophila LSv54]